MMIEEFATRSHRRIGEEWSDSPYNHIACYIPFDNPFTRLIIETSGYPAGNGTQQQNDRGPRTSTPSQITDSLSYGPSELPDVTADFPIVALRHESGAQVNVLLRPQSFSGWYRSDSNRLPGAIPFGRVSEIAYVGGLVPELVRRLDVDSHRSAQIRRQTIVNTYQMRSAAGFGQYLSADVNVEVELRRENLAVNFRNWPPPRFGLPVDDRLPMEARLSSPFALMPCMPESGNITVDALFAHMINVERRSSGAARWWPGVILRYQMVRATQPDVYSATSLTAATASIAAR